MTVLFEDLYFLLSLRLASLGDIWILVMPGSRSPGRGSV